MYTSKLPDSAIHIFSYMTGLANRYNAVNLSQGFPDFEPDPYLVELVSTSLAENTHQYAPSAGILPLREAIAKKLKKGIGIEVNPETEITVGCGATEMIFNTIAAFIWPGDEVIIIEPGYDCYRPAIILMGGMPVVYKMNAPGFKIDWAELGQCITSKTKMICINTPNNPTGTVLTHEDMLALAALVKGTNIIIMSDEVYEHMVFDEKTHLSPLMYADLQSRTIAVYSFGKTLHITGWRIGYAVAEPHLTDELRKVHQNNVFGAPHPLQKAIAHYLESDSYLSLPGFYQRKRDVFRSLISGSKLQLLDCEGSYFQLADYSQVSEKSDLEFCEWLVKEAGVAAIPVSKLYSDGHDDKLLRFCFAKKDETLTEAGKRLMAL